MSDPDTARPHRRRGIYSIAVAAELIGIGVPTLRLYEARGVIEPARTDGGTRRYSDEDVDIARRALRLLEEGFNLAAVRRIIELEDANRRLRSALEALRSQ